MTPTTATKDETEASHSTAVQKKKTPSVTPIGAFASIDEFAKVCIYNMLSIRKYI